MIEPQHGANQNISDGTGTKVLTREAAAQEAGFSKRQLVTATRIANIPSDDFEDMAKRIRARALRRAGELASQIMQPQGRPEKDTARDTFSKAAIQESSGFSKRQLETATRIAKIPADDFEDMAKRIRARAMRRAGELLKQVEPSKGGRPPETDTATDTSLTRKSAAAGAGLSKRQADTAKRLASIPEDDFEEMVERGATVTELAAAGTLHREPNRDEAKPMQSPSAPALKCGWLRNTTRRRTGARCRSRAATE